MTPSHTATTTASESNNHNSSFQETAHPDAIVWKATPQGLREPERETLRAELPAVPIDRRSSFSFPWNDAGSTIPERDRSMLAALVLLRLLSYDQLHRLLFSERDRSALRHRLAALAKRGWIARWDRARTATRAERYALPTAQALDAAIAAIRLRADGTTFGALVAQMLPKVRRPLVLAAAHDPKWLQHQREVNDLVISIVAARSIAWASTWDAPFASKAGIVDLPQPDYVVIERHGSTSELVFGEHDRGNEPVDRFIARKIVPYVDLLRFPEVLREHCGADSFRVDVSVLDAPRQRPIRRLIELLDAAAAAEHPELFRLTLAGWLAAHPDDPTWFTASNRPQSESVAWDDHSESRER
jgi:hypothetical protein